MLIVHRSLILPTQAYSRIAHSSGCYDENWAQLFLRRQSLRNACWRIAQSSGCYDENWAQPFLRRQSLRNGTQIFRASGTCNTPQYYIQQQQQQTTLYIRPPKAHQAAGSMICGNWAKIAKEVVGTCVGRFESATGVARTVLVVSTRAGTNLAAAES